MLLRRFKCVLRASCGWSAMISIAQQRLAADQRPEQRRTVSRSTRLLSMWALALGISVWNWKLQHFRFTEALPLSL